MHCTICDFWEYLSEKHGFEKHILENQENSQRESRVDETAAGCYDTKLGLISFGFARNYGFCLFQFIIKRGILVKELVVSRIFAEKKTLQKINFSENLQKLNFFKVQK